MKKRTVIVIIITIIAIIATNKYWFNIRPLPVNFDISGHGNCNIEVQLNKKDNNEFKKVKSASIYINLDEKKHANIFVKKAKHPKRIKLILSDLTSKEPVTISNIQLTDERFTLENIEKFKVDGAKVKVKDNSLILIPDNNVITLTYPKTLHIQTRTDFNFIIFSIILVLVCLLAYKLSDYAAKFNTIKGKSRIEIAFLTTFFIFLFIPMLHINNNDTSERENRTLAKWKPLIAKDDTINAEFGKSFDEWFNDRFYLRQLFIDIYYLKFMLSPNWIVKNVIKGDNNWFFLGWKESIDSYTNSIMLTDTELASIDKYLNSINNYCKMHNKNFYFVIIPDKSKIYPEYYTKSINKLSEVSRTKQLLDYIKSHSNVKVTYPKDRLISQKGKNLLYWKQDTHWNLLGAYYGYSELMDMIVKDYTKLPVYKASTYTTENHAGDLYDMLPVILKQRDNTIYTIPKIDDSNRCKQPKEPRGIVECSNSASDVNLLMFRDSFSTSLIPYLSYSFRQSMYVWKYDVSPKLMNNADIIILEVAERCIPELIGKSVRI